MRLGRLVKHDPASRAFEAARAPALHSVQHVAHGLPLDQGSLGSCTGNALIGALQCLPGSSYTESDARSLYALETQLEGTPWPPNDPGGSGLMVCKAAKQLGMITSYAHAFGLAHALHALVLRPVITGIDWYSSFDNPNMGGRVEITPGATIRGGHEVVVTGIDVEHQLIWCWNSWGPSYGLGGRFCMDWGTWDHLLQTQGDVTVPHTKVG